MTMTRQHFALIAEAIRDAYKGSLDNRDAQGACLAVAIHMADKLRSTNPNFNRDRFLRACGVED